MARVALVSDGPIDWGDGDVRVAERRWERSSHVARLSNSDVYHKSAGHSKETHEHD